MQLFQSVWNPDSVGFLGQSIGQELGLPQSAVEEIRTNFQSATQRKEAYLDTYTHNHPYPTWKVLVQVLRVCDLDQQAEQVQETFVQGMTLYVCTFTIRAT